MNPEDQQNLVVLLGGIFIWGVTIGVGIITLKIQASITLRVAFALALMVGITFSVGYLLIVQAVQSDNDIPRLAEQVPGFVTMYLVFIFSAFLLFLWREWSSQKFWQWMNQWLERKRKKMEHKK
jgi:nitrogen fixation/metabolism regulation signal transduction histidine kinase